MTGGWMQRYALTLFLTLCIIWAVPCASRPDEGRAREASQMWGGERSCSRPRTPVGGRPLVPSGCQVETPKSPACEEASWLFHHSHSNRAGLPVAPPSIDSTAQGSHALGLRVLARRNHAGDPPPPCPGRPPLLTDGQLHSHLDQAGLFPCPVNSSTTCVASPRPIRAARRSWI